MNYQFESGAGSMEVVHSTGGPYPTAHELPNKKIEWTNGRNKSSPSGNSGNKKRKASRTQKGAGLQLIADVMKAARQQTEDNRMILVIDGTGKKRWRRLKDYNAKPSRSNAQSK